MKVVTGIQPALPATSPLRHLLPEMEKRGITVLTHGATGRGNDQVRFQLACQHDES